MSTPTVIPIPYFHLSLGKLKEVRFDPADADGEALFGRYTLAPTLLSRFGLPAPGPEGRALLCELIDRCVDGTITSEHHDGPVSNAEAKAYINSYEDIAGPLEPWDGDAEKIDWAAIKARMQQAKRRRDADFSALFAVGEGKAEGEGQP
jgi:hypothetical protein